uniref:Uncharacterized protein n=1 Tax=Chromera velia CCMP2878 TaxID=1169474 RepID=A0A0G4HXY9_9ALVE|eukprot:Cvel_33356.t1-p1 / transcript=Cvel_33356.t1 / gene=Cvel_33356 / organism=Chromera_velia_CCMP2878 / gene_product=hypothetical protein / transcript_product=hypothetical protein / location=Cvel_scaffold5394:3935-4383(+) / protein_length=83 / sequence_SO=supercontig / SO=protein_coding / is_pseudo=false
MLDSFISSVFGSRGRSGDGVAAQFGGANEMGKPGPVLGLAIESSKSAAGTGSLASSADLSSETRSSALKRHVLVVVTPRCIER